MMKGIRTRLVVYFGLILLLIVLLLEGLFYWAVHSYYFGTATEALVTRTTTFTNFINKYTTSYSLKDKARYILENVSNQEYAKVEIKEISQIGVILLMFIAGLETDIDEFKRTAKASTNVGVAGIIAPLALGYGAGIVMGLSAIEAIFLGLLLSATSVSISVQTLKELGKLKSREGATIMGAAVIDDILVILALAFLMSFAGGDVNLGMVVLKKVAFFAVIILLSWKVGHMINLTFGHIKRSCID